MLYLKSRIERPYGLKPTLESPYELAPVVDRPYNLVTKVDRVYGLDSKLEKIYSLKAGIWYSTTAKYEYHDSDAYAGQSFYGANWLAQSFTPQTTHNLTEVKLLMYKHADSIADVTVSIRATASSVPTGADLTSNTFDSEDLTTDTDGGWKSVSLTTQEVIAGTEYAIIARQPSGDATHCVYWVLSASKTEDYYTRGILATSTDSGVNWTGESSYDGLFEEWGGLQGGLHITPFLERSYRLEAELERPYKLVPKLEKQYKLRGRLG